MEHVQKLGEEHPPLRLESADRTIRHPDLVRKRFTGVLNFLARVELEVDRNVLELLTIMPNPREVDRVFYADVWSHQEMAHGYLLDQLQGDLGITPEEPYMTIPLRIRLLGALAHWEPIQQVSRLLYYLTGAATERQAVLAYSKLSAALLEMGETPTAETVIQPIKRQEPGHFAFYRMSATQMIQDMELAPWQLFLARLLRTTNFTLVGVDYVKKYQRDLGGVLVGLGMDQELEIYAREMGRAEAQLLWAHRKGMKFPPYFLKALRESVEMYRGQGNFDRPGSGT